MFTGRLSHVAGVMVRLMLLLSPAVCLLGGMAVSWGIEVSVTSVRAVLFRQQEGGHDGAQGLEADEVRGGRRRAGR